MNDTILGVLIGSGLSLVGSLITILSNFIIEKKRNKYREKDYFQKRREEIYKTLYYLYDSYSYSNDRNQTIRDILKASSDINIYGSKKVQDIVRKIEVNENTNDFDEKQLNEFRKAIREELGVID